MGLYPQAGLSRLESGATAQIPPLSRLLRLAEVYGVDPVVMLDQAGVCVEVPVAAPADELDRLDLAAREALSAFLRLRWGA